MPVCSRLLDTIQVSPLLPSADLLRPSHSRAIIVLGPKTMVKMYASMCIPPWRAEAHGWMVNSLLSVALLSPEVRY